MKFKKILIVGFEKSELFSVTLKKLQRLSRENVFCKETDSNLPIYQKNADCLLVKFNPVTKSDIQSSPNLKYIGVMSTGFAKVDTTYARKRGVTVTNVPGYSTESVSEFVFAVLLEYLRELERAKIQARKENYSEEGFTAKEIKGKNFGILGLGRIGMRVAELALGFNANVSYWSKHRKKDFERRDVKYQMPDALISQSDFLSLHFALNKDTENFLNKERIAKFKKGTVIINTAPMELVDLGALENRLKKKDITFILDHSDEMKPKDLRRLLKYKNCIIYPPVAYISKEAKEAKQNILIENMSNFLKGSPTNVVN